MIEGNAAALAIDFEKFPMILRREAAGTWDDTGTYIPAQKVDMAVSAALQPAQGSQLEDLPEGVRTEARMFAWSRTALEIDDQIVDGTKIYRVIYIWDRQRDGGFTKAALGLLKS